MKFGIFLLILSAICFVTGQLVKGEIEMIDVNSGCVFFGLLFMITGGAAVIGGGK